jgi:hypothetical protein
MVVEIDNRALGHGGGTEAEAAGQVAGDGVAHGRGAKPVRVGYRYMSGPATS